MASEEQPLVPRHIRLAAMSSELRAHCANLTWDASQDLAAKMLELAEARMESVQTPSSVV